MTGEALTFAFEDPLAASGIAQGRHVGGWWGTPRYRSEIGHNPVRLLLREIEALHGRSGDAVPDDPCDLIVGRCPSESPRHQGDALHLVSG
jgi:hypothetical protein